MTKDEEIGHWKMQFGECLDLLDDMVCQHCASCDSSGRHLPDEYDSGYLTFNAKAMEFLVRHGRLEHMQPPYGRVVKCRRVK